MERRRIAWLVALAVVPAFAYAPLALASRVNGTIRSVFPVAGRIVLENGSTLAVDADTQIRVGGRQGTLAGLQPGERVQARYRSENNENMATMITVRRTPGHHA